MRQRPPRLLPACFSRPVVCLVPNCRPEDRDRQCQEHSIAFQSFFCAKFVVPAQIERHRMKGAVPPPVADLRSNPRHARGRYWRFPVRAVSSRPLSASALEADRSPRNNIPRARCKKNPSLFATLIEIPIVKRWTYRTFQASTRSVKPGAFARRPSTSASANQRSAPGSRGSRMRLAPGCSSAGAAARSRRYATAHPRVAGRR